MPASERYCPLTLAIIFLKTIFLLLFAQKSNGTVLASPTLPNFRKSGARMVNGGGLALLLTWVIVGMQAAKTAMANPARSLRSE